ncbi:MAG: carbamoyltransferase N-terminal domain-containing protein, partial [Deltaproteobacteria bacterium]
MKIVAFSDNHNASAALFIDGKLKLAIQEERFSRKKNHTGFPKQALDDLLRESGNSFEDIDHYLFVSKYLPKPGPDSSSNKIRAYKKSFSIL